ncbi:hypothetical protein HHK36_025449 [Tetracentron sinense]|uniref:PGG domain-containing protein n=1 Tax=Tetracentron sinense TaxID=13715 RepID=A0A834YGU4_TETSI|nr:hypothetical protein HHK36_025449 [Tetracentron sinense]
MEVEFVERSSQQASPRGNAREGTERRLGQSSNRGIERAVMERRLYEASLKGCVRSLNELMEENEVILHRVSVTCFHETPLHIAAMLGHFDFVRAILWLKPKLASELDSQGCSPLHLASAEGYLDIVRELLLIDANVCSVRDQDGRTPLHLAAMRGRVDVIKELLVGVTKITADQGETASLHLCVEHNRLEALKVLVESVTDVDEFINSRDDNGNTLLHLAAANKQLKTIKYLLSRTGVKVNSLNKNGFTAIDVVEHCPRDLKGMEVRESLREAGALRARDLPSEARTKDIRGNEVSLVVARNDVVGRPVVPANVERPLSCGKERTFMERRLYETSLHGSIHSLNELMEENEVILHRVSVTCFHETPLHIAAMLGHFDFVRAILSRKPKIASELDSHGCSPLHLASTEGYVDIVRELLLIYADVCSVRNEDGRTPLHLAAARGRVDVVKELVQARPEVTRIKADHGETALHLCVEYNRLDALKVLVESVTDDEFINSKDDNGNTVFHLAVAKKQMQTVKYLLTLTGLEVNALNSNTFTAVDVVEQCPRDLKGMEVRESLREAKALRARDLALAPSNTKDRRGNEISPVVTPNAARPLSRGRSWKKHVKNQDKWLKRKRDTLMVAATLIAAMALQAGLNPPGVFGKRTQKMMMETIYIWLGRLFWLITIHWDTLESWLTTQCHSLCH